MRSEQGKGYTLFAFDSANGLVLGPGIAFVFDGVWELDRDQVVGGQGVELLAPVTFAGNGLVAAVTYKDDSPSGLSPRFVWRDVVKHDKPWGWELEVMSELKRVQLKLIHVEDGHRTSEQYHEQKHEVMMHLPDCCQKVQVVHPREVHRVAGPHTYFEASTYYPHDVVRVSDDYGR